MDRKPAELPGRANIHLLTISGIRINLDYSWFIVFGLVLLALSLGYFPRHYPGQETEAYWVAGFIATLFFFISVLIHELAHSLVAIHHGLEIPEITLFIFGGVSRLAEEPREPRLELKIALVGPLSSFALAAVFWLIKTTLAGFGTSLIVEVFDYLAWINLALGIFNLVPGFPLDGGRVLRAIVWLKTGSLTRATKAASDIGKGFAVALMVLGGLQIFAGALISGLWFLFIGMFLRGMSARGYEEVIIRKALEGVRVQEVMTREVVSVSPDLSAARLVADYFLHYAYGGFPVVRNGQVLGIVSVTALKGLSPEALEQTQVSQVMTPLSDDLVITADSSLADALREMAQSGADRLLVMEQGKLVGLLTKTGLLRFVQIKQILEP
jgi:Zn-dependent protease/predicted transcriptional regulator